MPPVTFRSSGGPGSPTVISERTRVRDELAGMTLDEFERATGQGEYAPKIDRLGYDDQGNIAGGGQALSFNEFMERTGRSPTNPFGNEGIMTRLAGLDPSSVNYTAQYANMPGQINYLNELAYDRYMRPFAATDMRGRRVGGDMTTGATRLGVEPGTLTRFGVAEAPPPNVSEGIAGLAEKIPGFLPGIGLAQNFLAPKPAVIPEFGIDPDLQLQPDDDSGGLFLQSDDVLR